MFLFPLLSGPVRGADDVAEAPPIQPSLGVRFDFSDNIYNSDVTQIESWIGVISPAVLFSAGNSPQRYELLYAGQYGRFFDGSVDNYADHLLAGRANLQLGYRGRLSLSADTEKGHEGRGSGLSSGIEPDSPSFPREPIEFDRSNWSGEFIYGAEGARGQLTLEFGGYQLDYTNNPERTDPYDREGLSASTRLALGLAERTSVVFEVQWADVRYDLVRPGQVSRDGDNWRYLIGVSWEATAKTEGSISLGRQQRSFDDPGREKESGATWDARVRWSPREYSRFDFLTSRANEETIGEGAFIDRSSYQIEWTHDWSGGWETRVGWSRSKSDFADSVREETINSSYVGLRYPQGRLLTWEAGYRVSSRDGSLSRLKYDGKVLSIGVNIGI